METSERERVARLVRDARTHAEEAETSLGEREDDLTPLERRSAVDFATEMALFGWFPVPLVEGVESEKRAYGCALCGARSPEWTFTSVLAARKQHVSSAQRTSKRAKTTGAALRGALGGSYGLSGVSSVPFAPTRRDGRTADDAHKAAHERASAMGRRRRGGERAIETDDEHRRRWRDGDGKERDAFRRDVGVDAVIRKSATGDGDGERRRARRARQPRIDVRGRRRRRSDEKARRGVVQETQTRRRRRQRQASRPGARRSSTIADEHMPYCPWICREIDHRPTEPGWRATLDVLMPKSPVDDDDARVTRG